MLFSGILISLLCTFFLFSPYGEGRPQPIEATYVIDEVEDRHFLELSSPAPLRNVQALQGGTVISIDTRSRRYTLPLADSGSYLETELSSIGFLDRQNVNLRLDPWSEPYRVRLNVSAEEEFVLFDANFPYTRSPGGREYTILIGVNPPVPLEVQLTVPKNRTFSVGIALEYLRPPQGYEIRGRFASISSQLRFRRNLELKT